MFEEGGLCGLALTLSFNKLPTFWIHTVRFGSKMYVLDPTRAAIQALAPTGAGSKYQWTGLDTEGLPVTQTAVLPA